MSDRTLFVHAGGSKTGSSALQNFFEINAARLESLGFAYGNRANIENDHEINSGNGLLLYQSMLAADITDDEIDSVVLSYFGRCNNAICSSEYLQYTQPLGWRKLLESTLRLGVKLKAIFYVRNVIPFFLSTYDQVIKCHGEWREFDEWAVRVNWQHANSLRIIANELPKLSIQIIHFDRVRASLIRSFLNILGVDASFEIGSKDQERQVNRSLMREEREVLITANKALGATYSKELSELLIYADLNAQGEPASYNKTTVDLLLDRYDTEVKWVNSTFFNGQSAVSVLPIKSVKKSLSLKSLSIKSKTKPEQKDNNAEKQALDWALEKLKTIKDETEQTIMNAIRVAVQNNSGKFYPDIPSDFDVVAYLLLNHDVLHAGVDPIHHFINYGKNEGRAYKFFKEAELNGADCQINVSLDKKNNTAVDLDHANEEV